MILKSFIITYDYSKGILKLIKLPDGFIAQLVKHCTGIAEVMGLNPVQAFFQALISQLLKLCV